SIPGIPIPTITSAIYNASQDSVTLMLAQPFTIPQIATLPGPPQPQDVLSVSLSSQIETPAEINAASLLHLSGTLHAVYYPVPSTSLSFWASPFTQLNASGSINPLGHVTGDGSFPDPYAPITSQGLEQYLHNKFGEIHVSLHNMQWVNSHDAVGD